MDTNNGAKTMPTLTVVLARRNIHVDTFAEAARHVRQFIAARAIGNTAYSRGGNGTIRFNGEDVARVSYNGRMWCKRCEGEIDGDPSAQFPGKPCGCGHTDHANALACI